MINEKGSVAGSAESQPRPARTTREQQKAATRAALLDAAYEVFTAGAVATTPTEEVAKAAGVSKATLFFHFGTRIELLEAVATRVYHTGVETVWRPAQTGLMSFLRTYLASNRTPAARLIWEVGDELIVARRPYPDVAYLHLIGEIEGQLVHDGFAADSRPSLARLIAPGTLWVARRVAFGQADEDEVQRFLADVETTLHGGGWSQT